MIPNVIHFVFGLSPDFGGKPFSLVHHLAVRSAYEVNRPDKIYLHCKHRPSGEWWDRSLPYLDLVDLEPPTAVAGVPIEHVAHRADVARLDILCAQGGIYLDLDVLCVRPFTPLLDHQVVLGAQESIDPAAPGGPLRRDGLCASVILAEPGAEFMRTWRDGLDPAKSLWSGFRSTGYDEHWDEYSVRYPEMLANRHPDLVHVEGHRSFFWPSWNAPGLSMLFDEGDEEFPDAYCHHLWEMNAWEPYLKDLSIANLKRGKTPFSRLAGRFLD
ncbi:glycosyltransferase family 32 protein [Amycolatopsis sp. WAC 04197]|uniref:glycosyltransferase family 32 protein n=1 Tax=Amycolatopsis sp. WAC 04197 TaxID=2203199 RepID=UPI0013154F69|nr:glycosyltransferase [Amycolatopsis sp. WAC 04197]